MSPAQNQEISSLPRSALSASPRNPARLGLVCLLLLLLAGAAPSAHQAASLSAGDLQDVIALAPAGGGATPREERQQAAPDAPLLGQGSLLALPALGWRFCRHLAAERSALKRGIPNRIDRPPTLA